MSSTRLNKPPPPRLAAASAELLRELVAGLQADRRDYQSLGALIQNQFDAALRHDAHALLPLGGQIDAQVQLLNERRRERLRIAAALGLQPPMAVDALMALLPAPLRGPVHTLWQELEDHVRACKAQNARNCALLMEQNALMQRVLQPEADTYAPA